MTAEERAKALAAWIATRPQCVQRLAEEFPVGTVVGIHGRKLYLIGWTEGDELILSSIDPFADYEGATAAREYLCASHVREALNSSRGQT